MIDIINYNTIYYKTWDIMAHHQKWGMTTYAMDISGVGHLLGSILIDLIK